MDIISNFQWRNFLYGYELTEAEKADFDYVEDLDSSNFIRYRGRVYSLDDFMRVEPGMLTMHGKNWHGYNSDSFFSGTLVELSDCGDQYRIATYIN